MIHYYKLLLIAALSLALFSCAVGHQDYTSFMDERVGQLMKHKEPYKFENAGEFSRGDFAINGQGLTHITTNENDDLIYHYSDQEILPNYHVKEWIGKCLLFYVVDSKTYIIKSWGFDKGGNPLSCRTWP